MFGKQRNTTIVKIAIPPVQLHYLALVFCNVEDARPLYDELVLLAHCREWKVQTTYRISPKMVLGVIAVDLIGDRAYDEFNVDIARYRQVKDVVHFLVKQ